VIAALQRNSRSPNGYNGPVASIETKGVLPTFAPFCTKGSNAQIETFAKSWSAGHLDGANGPEPTLAGLGHAAAQIHRTGHSSIAQNTCELSGPILRRDLVPFYSAIDSLPLI
jgi:hypothetical protein